MPPAEDKLNGRAAVKGRDAQRQQTRQRVYAAALAEFKRTGMAAADVGDIATAAGVARGTFYFHFPTKEHVLAELERHEEARLVAQLSKFLAELGTRCRAVAGPGGLQPHRLPAPVHSGEAAPGQRAAQLARRVRAGHVAVGVIDVHDPPVQGLLGDQTAGGLDLRKFWHPPRLAAASAA